MNTSLLVSVECEDVSVGGREDGRLIQAGGLGTSGRMGKSHV